MSGPHDNFLARWSRRKREVGEAEEEESNRTEERPSSLRGANHPSPLRGERMGEGSSGVELGIDDPDPSPSPQGGGESPGSAEPLPSLDDLTAESDLSAFMRAGVPEALKKAALRRMWSLDPAIRDHVGLAEYAWDFNNPGSMAGFGAVAAGTPMAQLAASIMSGQGSVAGVPKEKTAVPGLPERGVAGPPPLLDQAGSSGADDRAVGPDDPLTVPDPKPVSALAKVGEDAQQETSGADASGKADVPCTGVEDPESRGHTRENTGPRHGGAMPR
jgi:hypothetical protein